MPMVLKLSVRSLSERSVCSIPFARAPASTTKLEFEEALVIISMLCVDNPKISFKTFMLNSLSLYVTSVSTLVLPENLSSIVRTILISPL